MPGIRRSTGCCNSTTRARPTRPSWKTSCRWTWRSACRRRGAWCCITPTAAPATATDFLPIDEPVPPAAKIQLAPQGGRSSNGCLPFFNVQWPGGGLVGAIGWSGQWAMRLHRDQGPRLTLQAGQQKTHLVLHPGEAIRTPRMLLVSWDGDDRLRGHNLLRRLLLDHYVPRIDGEIAIPPLTHNTWFMFNEGNAVTEQNQLDAIRSEAPLGIEGYLARRRVV